jgi:hypothetical protein
LTGVLSDEALHLAEVLWEYHYLKGPLEKSDCIVGLGSYDLRVAERCADLYFEKWAPLIIFSGYLGNWTKRMWHRSEAEIFAEHAIARGVPANKIVLSDTEYKSMSAFSRSQPCLRQKGRPTNE